MWFHKYRIEKRELTLITKGVSLTLISYVFLLSEKVYVIWFGRLDFSWRGWLQQRWLTDCFSLLTNDPAFTHHLSLTVQTEKHLAEVDTAAHLKHSDESKWLTAMDSWRSAGVHNNGYKYVTEDFDTTEDGFTAIWVCLIDLISKWKDAYNPERFRLMHALFYLLIKDSS